MNAKDLLIMSSFAVLRRSSLGTPSFLQIKGKPEVVDKRLSAVACRDVGRVGGPHAQFRR